MDTNSRAYRKAEAIIQTVADREANAPAPAKKVRMAETLAFGDSHKALTGTSPFHRRAISC